MYYCFMLISVNRSVISTQFNREPSLFFSSLSSFGGILVKKIKFKNRSEEFKQCNVFSCRPFMLQGQVSHEVWLLILTNDTKVGSPFCVRQKVYYYRVTPPEASQFFWLCCGWRGGRVFAPLSWSRAPQRSMEKGPWWIGPTQED